MIMEFVTWWLAPALVTLICFLLMLRHDEQDLSNFSPDDWWVLLLFIVVWPIGAIALVVLLVDWLRDE